MKKIIFVINNLETGGVQISLLNLLNEIKNDYDVSLLVFSYKEQYEELIPSGVRLIRIRSPFKEFGRFKKDVRSNPFSFAERTFWFAITKLFGRSAAIRLMCPFQRKIRGYDAAISFLHEGDQKSLYGGCNEFVLRKVEAERKITWLHGDFELCGANNKKSYGIYEQFDKIVACSEGTRNAFIKCMPEFAHKTVAIRNCHDYEKIKTLAEESVEYGNECFNIVTVARLSAEKGIDRALEAVAYCKSRGEKIRYHIVGEGIERAFLEKKVSQLSLENDVVFYGNQANPYEYMVGSDLLLLTSYHEAAPMVFDEAACLGVPVLTTATTSAEEMVGACGHGFVCENNQEAINKALLDVLVNRERLETVRATLRSSSFDNSEKKRRFNELVR